MQSNRSISITSERVVAGMGTHSVVTKATDVSRPAEEKPIADKTACCIACGSGWVVRIEMKKKRRRKKKEKEKK